MRKFVNQLADPFRSLQNRLFARLYLAQSISLFGDAITWVGIALLAYQFGAARSAIILSIALTLRVAAFIIFSPFAGVLADKFDRKKILYLTHFARMIIVACFPFVKAEWQIYVLIFSLNIFNAFFTPTYRTVIPHIIDKKFYRQAIGLSSATYQLLGVIGPGLAGILAIWLGAREIFFVDAVSFIVAGILIITLPEKSLNPQTDKISEVKPSSTWSHIAKGAKLLFGHKAIRFALFIEFVTAIAGAQILVNTVGHVKFGLHLSDEFYGWAMAAFGIGAAVAAFISGVVDKTPSRRISLVSGALLLGLAISGANYVGFGALFAMWLLAGLGQSLAEIPSETLIGEQIAEDEQGKVYGSHFAFSHLWWAIAYPVAGFLGTRFASRAFLYGGIITLILAIAAALAIRPSSNKHKKPL